MPILSRRQSFATGAALMATPLAGGLVAGRAFAETSAGAVASPNIRRFPLGAFEVTTIYDGQIALEDPHTIFGTDQEPATVAQIAEQNFLPADKLVIGFTPIIVNTGEQVILFDAGNGARRRPDAGKLVSQLANAGFSADQIDTVVITHMHPDHIGGLMEEGSPTFPNAAYVTGQVEYDFWSSEDRLSGPTEGTATLVQSNVVPLADKMSFIDDGKDVVTGVTAIGAGGHTPGHMAYHIESEGERLLLWGDAANHYVFSIQHPDWHVRFDMDKDAAAATRRNLFDMAAGERIPVTGYHMPFPAVGFIEGTADGHRWVPMTYQLDL
ncbi:MAG: MBL fold metallo-hydrolase [Geminicoccaceae bacterium]